MSTEPLRRQASGIGALMLYVGGAGILAGLLSSCNIVGPALYLVHGPNKVEPAYALDPERPVLVFVDDRASVLPNRTVRRLIGEAVEQRLVENKGAGTIISSQGIAAITSRERFSRPIGIAQVGRELGAEVVIFATIDAFTNSEDGQSNSPAAVVRTKVVDAETEQRLWPTEGGLEWHRLVVELPRTQGVAPTDTQSVTKIQNALAAEIGMQVGNLFVEHYAQRSVIRGED